MCDTSLHIPIDHFNGSAEGGDLMECYFQWVTEINGINFYDFYDRRGQKRVAGLRVGDRFNFALPHVEDIVWVLNITGGSCTFVGGNWSGVPKDRPIDDVVPEPDQSYQAQAGGALVYEENAVAATA
ncbi:MAG TPA: hypothetical protein VKB05_11730 [Pyrinomonadaceae bacterium]|nr:hypothetical protein [Pyrinomonadaceae bacterium]